jgi:hypothetical protein
LHLLAQGQDESAMLEKMKDGMQEFQPQVQKKDILSLVVKASCCIFCSSLSYRHDVCRQISKTMTAVINELIKRSDKMADDIFEAIDGRTKMHKIVQNHSELLAYFQACLMISLLVVTEAFCKLNFKCSRRQQRRHCYAQGI